MASTNASAAAEKKAQELGVDLDKVEATGASGSITVADVEKHAETSDAEAEARRQDPATVEGALSGAAEEATTDNPNFVPGQVVSQYEGAAPTERTDLSGAANDMEARALGAEVKVVLNPVRQRRYQTDGIRAFVPAAGEMREFSSTEPNYLTAEEWGSFKDTPFNMVDGSNPDSERFIVEAGEL